MSSSRFKDLDFDEDDILDLLGDSASTPVQPSLQALNTPNTSGTTQHLATEEPPLLPSLSSWSLKSKRERPLSTQSTTSDVPSFLSRGKRERPPRVGEASSFQSFAQSQVFEKIKTTETLPQESDQALVQVTDSRQAMSTGTVNMPSGFLENQVKSTSMVNSLVANPLPKPVIQPAASSSSLPTASSSVISNPLPTTTPSSVLLNSAPTAALSTTLPSSFSHTQSNNQINIQTSTNDNLKVVHPPATASAPTHVQDNNWLIEQLKQVLQSQSSSSQQATASDLHELKQVVHDLHHKIEHQTTELQAHVDQKLLHMATQMEKAQSERINVHELLERRLQPLESHIEQVVMGSTVWAQSLTQRIGPSLADSQSALKRIEDQLRQQVESMHAQLQEDRRLFRTEVETWQAARQRQQDELEHDRVQLSKEKTQWEQKQSDKQQKLNRQQEQLENEKIAMENEVEELSLGRTKLEQQVSDLKTDLEKLKHERLRMMNETKNYESMKQTLHQQELQLRQLHLTTVEDRERAVKAQREAERLMEDYEQLKLRLGVDQEELLRERRRVHAERLHMAKDLKVLAERKADLSLSYQLAMTSKHDDIIRTPLQPLPKETQTRFAPKHIPRPEKSSIDRVEQDWSVRRMRTDLLENQAELNSQHAFLQKAQLKIWS